MEKKYKLTAETCEYEGCVLHRIVALKDFSSVKAGDKGGWIEKEENLSQDGCCWVYGDAMVYGDAKVYGCARVHDNSNVYGDAKVYGYADVLGNVIVCGNARVYGDAKVYGDAIVYGNADVYGNVIVCGNARVYGDAKLTNNRDLIVFKNWWSSGRYFTWTRSNNKWRVGCFYGTGEELIAKAYSDSQESGREYERVVKYVESILKDEQQDNNNVK